MKKFVWLLILLSTNLMAGVVTYDCKFTSVSSPEGFERLNKSWDMKFITDDRTKNSYIVGHAGTEPVTLVNNAGGLSFVEVTASGNIQITALTLSGEAVHSRNSIIRDKLVPSQYYGKCSIL